MSFLVGMSTSCVFPSKTETAFKVASDLGYDGIEVMVTKDPPSQNASALNKFSEKYSLPIFSIHSPVLMLSSHVFGRNPREKLRRSCELAVSVGASTVVVHPPYLWQPVYALTFSNFVRELSAEFDLKIAVENMFNPEFFGVSLPVFAPSWDPSAPSMDVDYMTLDFSHCAYQGVSGLDLAKSMGDRLQHIHLCDGTHHHQRFHLLDEHLVPGRGTQPVAETLQHLSREGSSFSGFVVAEVHTDSYSKKKRRRKLVETLEFAKRFSI